MNRTHSKSQGFFAFGAAAFFGAFLVFLVQPLIAKYILPWFGGSPAVWSICVVFFQLLLLVGYGYAHLLTTYLTPLKQAVVHSGFLLLALFFLPIIPSESWRPSGADDPTWRILLLLLTCLGLPYGILSATGPLLQSWFAKARPHVSPYRLYALSNVGSLLSLIAYPFLVDPLLSRRQQAWGWSVAMMGFASLCSYCAYCFWRDTQDLNLENLIQVSPVETPAKTVDAPPSIESRLLWMGLPACASVLLLAVTNHLTQNVAPVPFLWVMPLSIYLLSFVLCFDHQRWYVRPVFAIGLFFTSIFVGKMLGRKYYDLTLRTELVGFGLFLFVACMVCHGELYRIRPGASRLTGYYLSIAAGGAIGGMFVTLVAPRVLRDYFELHIGIVACGAMTAYLLRNERWLVPHATVPRFVVRIGMWLAVLAVGIQLMRRGISAHRTDLAIWRNFYGTLAVYPRETGGGPVMEMRHGTVPHGSQFIDPIRRGQPTSYYGPDTGVGRAIRVLQSRGPVSMGVVGLGVGTLASYGRTGDTLRIYEINPDVKRLAEQHFSYLKDSQATVNVVMGDARLSLEREQPQQFDVLILDAFSGDSIPMHLMTREAVACYCRHLKRGGILAVHVSNVFLDLEPVVWRLAEAFHLRSVIFVEDKADEKLALEPADWMLLSEDAAILDSTEIATVSRPAKGSSKVLLWTDDRAALWPIVR